MTSPMTPHGFALLVTTADDATALWERQLYDAFRAAGFRPWDGTGQPLFAVLGGAAASKAQWFEAGLFAGARVPLFLCGRNRFRRKHREAVARAGGWLCECATAAELFAAVERRGITPSAWDREGTGGDVAAVG